MDLIKAVEQEFATEKELPAFKSGDTISVNYRITEGDKTRIQVFKGDVIRISGEGVNKRFTVRKTALVTYVVPSCTTSAVVAVRVLVSRSVVPSDIDTVQETKSYRSAFECRSVALFSL